MIRKEFTMAALLGVVAITGCRTVEDIIRDYNSNIAVGNYQEAAIEVTECAQKKDKNQLMWSLMSGSAYRLAGDTLKSNLQFDQAEDVMLDHDQTSVFSKGTAGAWAMMTNDKAFEYKNEGQDRIFACLYKAINFAVADKPDAARTEFNRAYQHQENWLYARRKDIASAQERMEKDIDAYNKDKNNARNCKPRLRTGRRKSGSLKIGKRCCGKSYPKRNAGRAATGWSSEAQSLRALCRKPRP